MFFLLKVTYEICHCQLYSKRILDTRSFLFALPLHFHSKKNNLVFTENRFLLTRFIRISFSFVKLLITAAVCFASFRSDVELFVNSNFAKLALNFVC